MDETIEKPINDGTLMVERNPDGTIKSGVLNPKGKAPGTLAFKTQWFNFIEKVAKENNLKPEDIQNNLNKVGLNKAQEGDFQFYKDLHDRIYGKPVQPIEGDVNSELTIKIINFGEPIKEI